MASGAPGLLYVKIDDFSFKNQLSNGLQSSRLDLYENWWIFNEALEQAWSIVCDAACFATIIKTPYYFCFCFFAWVQNSNNLIVSLVFWSCLVLKGNEWGSVVCSLLPFKTQKTKKTKFNITFPDQVTQETKQEIKY